jgi:hypothetical protein
MEPYTRNGSIIGKTMDFGTTDFYIPPSADITFVGGTGRQTLSSGTLALPSGLQPGDLVIIATSSDTISNLGLAQGYTLGGDIFETDTIFGRWCYKFMGSPVDTSASGLTNDSRTTHLAVAFRGVDPNNPLDVPATSEAISGQGLPNAPQIVTITNNAMIVALGFHDDDLIANSIQAPTGYTFGAASQSTSIGSTVMAAHKVLATAGAEDPPPFIDTNQNIDTVSAIALALRPAPDPNGGGSNNKKNSGIWDLQAVLEVLSAPASAGQQEYTTPGTYSWIAPAGLTSVSVVCVGGGGGGVSADGAGGNGGSGGGLGWKNNITVVPGQSYTVVVGAGGTRITGGTGTTAGNGGVSYFIDTSTVAGFGGLGGISRTSSFREGGSYTGDGGGNGGGVQNSTSTADATGGGGAGGYSGNGGNGASINSAGSAGQGGGGGGGGAGGSSDAAGAGGGVGIYGEGASGAGGTYNGVNGGEGGGGSGGADGSGSPGSTLRPSTGGAFGGGGGGAELNGENGPGAGGAVRIIWGDATITRAFPSTNTGDV